MAAQELNIQSSNIKLAAYDPETQRLAITFHSGHSGVYVGVSEEDAGALEQAPSPGRYLQDFIIPMYSYEKIG